MYSRSLALWVCLLALSGCATCEVHHDQERMRATLLDLYTKQLMDNLVRAVNGLPIIQLDYTNASANVTLEETAGVSESLQTTHTNVVTTVLKPVLAVTRQTVNTVGGTLNGNHTNSIALWANPVLSSNELYNAYLTFLGRPGRLQITCVAPPCGAAHISEKYCNEYYWVPEEYKEEFYQLALVVMAQRDRVLETPDTFRVTLLSIDEASKRDVPLSPEGSGTDIEVDVNIDKAIPNERGADSNPVRPAGGGSLTAADFKSLGEYFPISIYHKRNAPDSRKDYYVRDAGTLRMPVLYYRDDGGTYMGLEQTADKTAFTPTGDKVADASKADLFFPSNVRVFVTKRLRITLTPSAYDALRASLPYPVEVRLYSKVPPPPTMSELLDRIPFRVPQVTIKHPSSDDAAPSGASDGGGGSPK